ncbi:bifunctional DNA primase/polymerase [Streptomyces sp. NPDC050560]|uniref:bifunctional DNA primase/polymerase n=1 Tax=Streptomyces sp. NPDC050560 TaxID=3365630 RepID=UPI0037873A06
MNLRTAVALLRTPAARDWKSGASNLLGTNSRPLNEVVVNLLPTPKASDGPHGGPNQRESAGNYYLPGQAVRLDGRWMAGGGTPDGAANFAALCERAGHAVPTTRRIRTPSGGEHLYFTAPRGAWFTNTTGTLTPKVDTRAWGGQVVAPGSTTPHGPYTVLDDQPVANA